jgi:hypothetical protein
MLSAARRVKLVIDDVIRPPLVALTRNLSGYYEFCLKTPQISLDEVLLARAYDQSSFVLHPTASTDPADLASV